MLPPVAPSQQGLGQHPVPGGVDTYAGATAGRQAGTWGSPKEAQRSHNAPKTEGPFSGASGLCPPGTLTPSGKEDKSTSIIPNIASW